MNKLGFAIGHTGRKGNKMKGNKTDEIRVEFFDGVYDLIRVCSMFMVGDDYKHYQIYDIYPDDCMTVCYSGVDRSKALKWMEETYELTVEDEERI